MRFLFESTIIDKGEELHFKVYEYKLSPGKYRAELIEPLQKRTKEIIFWKDQGILKTNSHSEISKHIAEEITMELKKKDK